MYKLATLIYIFSTATKVYMPAMLLYFAHPQKLMGLQIQSFLRRIPAKKWRTQDIVVRLLINL